MVVFVVFLGVVLLLGAAAYGYFSRRIEMDAATTEVTTSYGTFVCRPRIDKSQWHGTANHRGGEITVSVPDREGAPDPEHLARISEALREIAELEKVAQSELRDYFEGESEEGPKAEQFTLSGVELGSKPHEYTLHYSMDEEAWGMSIFIQFEDGKVKDVTAVD